ncbi:MAG: 4-hydroxy-3-polyprenylbenzoate decarboxylase [Pseudohongiellaceae bacterium]|jgi:4-hydroxy-3-polyprenylbenzoate decarboxylase
MNKPIDSPTFPRTITLALTGASGAQYGLRLLECLLAANCRVYLMISRAAEIVIRAETDLVLPDASADTENNEQLSTLQERFNAKEGQLLLFSREDWFAPVASGSSSPASMVICPASGGTLSSIAHGASNNLIERAADVALKERRQLIVVSREAPYSQIHLENMLKITKMGAVVIPASPGFYHAPKTINDLIDFIVARILDQLNIEQKILSHWGE